MPPFQPPPDLPSARAARVPPVALLGGLAVLCHRGSLALGLAALALGLAGCGGVRVAPTLPTAATSRGDAGLSLPQEATALAEALTPADLAAAITEAAPLDRPRAEAALGQVKALIKSAKSKQVYEYAERYGELKRALRKTRNTKDIDMIGREAQVQAVHLGAMLANLRDSTGYRLAHASDQLLIRHHGLAGKVMVLSLREQALRLYEKGEVIDAIRVVTGRPDAGTPPGLWRVWRTIRHKKFVSRYAVGHALYYPPTHVDYAVQFDRYYYLHDAAWRSVFGAGANLPHKDTKSPGFSDVGTHGCVNMGGRDAKRLYLWATKDVPVLIY